MHTQPLHNSRILYTMSQPNNNTFSITNASDSNPEIVEMTTSFITNQPFHPKLLRTEEETATGIVTPELRGPGNPGPIPQGHEESGPLARNEAIHASSESGSLYPASPISEIRPTISGNQMVINTPQCIEEVSRNSGSPDITPHQFQTPTPHPFPSECRGSSHMETVHQRATGILAFVQRPVPESYSRKIAIAC